MSVLAAAVDPRMIRAYRRLLRVYPRGPRRAELLDTLLECASPGRRRPHLREIVNLVRHGTRARLGRPKSQGIVVLALFAALAGGFLGAAAGNQLGWQAVGPLPTGAAADAIREIVFPGLPVRGGGDAADIVGQGDGEGIEYGYAVSWVKHTVATRDVTAYTTAVRARLEAAGWTVTSVDPPLDRTYVGAEPGDRSEGFIAVRGALGLRFSDNYWPGRPAYDGDGTATYYLWHWPPSWVGVLTWSAFVPGALIAWLVTGWVSRRLESDPSMSRLVVVGGVLGMLAVVPTALLALLYVGPADETVAPSWQGLAYALSTPVPLLGVLAACLSLTVAVSASTKRASLNLAVLARRRRAVAAVSTAAVVLLGFGAYRLATRHLLSGSCTPTVPAGIVDPPSARMSYQARVFISAQATADERNYAEAAIWRGQSGAQTFQGDPGASGFTDPFCESGRPTATDADGLPRYWTVGLASPGLFQGLAAEAMVMPGVVAVQHVPG